jgi:osmotically-inducible protein OsmY
MTLRSLFVVLSLALVPTLPVRAGILEDRGIEDAIAGSFVFRQMLIDPSMVILYVRSGKVELRGQVSDERERDLLTFIIAALPNVGAVDNQLFVDSATRRTGERWEVFRQRAVLLMEGDLELERTRVEFSGGRWSLGGEVSSEAQIALVQQRAATLFPNTPLPLTLRVAPTVQGVPTLDDASIAAIVRSRLERTPGIQLQNARITSSQGVVLLYGTVASAAQIEVSLRLARSSRGVRGIDNQLRARP